MAPFSRAWVAFTFVTVCAAGASSLAEPISEGAVVRRFVEQSPQAARIRLAELSAASARRDQARPSNPSLRYEIEDAGGIRDEFVTAEQELPISGRRSLLRRSADAAADAAGHEARRNLSAAVAELRAAFYEVIYRERVRDRLEATRTHLERLVEVLAIREREGEGSGYDLIRAEQELAKIELAASEVQSAVEQARARFGAFFAPEQGMESAELRGSLQPSPPPPSAEQAVRRALQQRSDLRALRADEKRFELERRAARRRRLPEPTLSAGWKRTASLGTSQSGFTAALAVPIPLFDRGRAAATRADADRRRAGLEAEILERRVRADVRAAIARERTARAAALDHGRAVTRRAEEMRRIAELAYEEGEVGILELLDAHTTSLETHLRALAVRYEARRASIARERAIGTEVKP